MSFFLNMVVAKHVSPSLNEKKQFDEMVFLTSKNYVFYN
jgi:hypothetical protein